MSGDLNGLAHRLKNVQRELRRVVLPAVSVSQAPRLAEILTEDELREYEALVADVVLEDGSVDFPALADEELDRVCNLLQAGVVRWGDAPLGVLAR